VKAPLLLKKMTWNNDIFYYSVGILKGIVTSYQTIDSVLMIGDHQIVNRFGIALFKADFDYSLASIGRGHWRGLESLDFRYYRHFGRLQRVVIAKILGIEDRELGGLGFYNIPQYRHTAYKRMADSLNCLPNKKVQS
jgi:hypothetical protein